MPPFPDALNILHCMIQLFRVGTIYNSSSQIFDDLAKLFSYDSDRSLCVQNNLDRLIAKCKIQIFNTSIFEPVYLVPNHHTNSVSLSNIFVEFVTCVVTNHVLTYIVVSLLHLLNIRDISVILLVFQLLKSKEFKLIQSLNI